jgi:hypothetical protein
MSPSRNRSFRSAIAALAILLHAAQATAAFNPAFCAQVAGTLNIFWQATAGPFAPCTGIETTNGTLAQAATGTVTMNGIAVSNPACIGVAAYTLTLSPDTLALTGFDTANNVPMTLTRVPGQACFVGTWSQGADVYEAHIWALGFPLQSQAVPATGDAIAALLAMLLAFAGMFSLRRRRS